jgi:hypothetical protein
MSAQEQQYYLQRRPTLLRKHRGLMKIGQRVMARQYADDFVEMVIQESDAEFALLLPQIPYIGGEANPLTDTLEQMTSLLALYRVLTRHGIAVEEVGELAQNMAQTWIDQFPRLVRKLIGRFYMTRWNRASLRKRALESQQQVYPGNFVTEIVEQGDNFEWGVNYVECGVVKFFHAQNADEFTPYMCLIDMLMFPAMGIRFQREGTIANGCTHCDFRFG